MEIVQEKGRLFNVIIMNGGFVDFMFYRQQFKILYQIEQLSYYLSPQFITRFVMSAIADIYIESLWKSFIRGFNSGFFIRIIIHIYQLLNGHRFSEKPALG